MRGVGREDLHRPSALWAAAVGRGCTRLEVGGDGGGRWCTSCPWADRWHCPRCWWRRTPPPPRLSPCPSWDWSTVLRTLSVSSPPLPLPRLCSCGDGQRVWVAHAGDARPIAGDWGGHGRGGCSGRGRRHPGARGGGCVWQAVGRPPAPGAQGASRRRRACASGSRCGGPHCPPLLPPQLPTGHFAGRPTPAPRFSPFAFLFTFSLSLFSSWCCCAHVLCTRPPNGRAWVPRRASGCSRERPLAPTARSVGPPPFPTDRRESR